LTTMGGLAPLLSALGIFGLVTNTVAQRTKEIGIRIALGSTIREAMIHIGVPGARAATLGLMVGFGLCAGVLRVMRSVLYGIAVYDPPTMIAVVAVLASVALIASTLPTMRIARIDPATTLREE
jgi:ABC-type antimicrobial peptide transport system permease subunit